MNNERNKAVELTETELENIVGGRVYYIRTSQPVIDAAGNKRYEVFSAENAIVGDIAGFYNKGGAEYLSGHLSLQYGTVSEKKIQAYLDLLRKRNETINEF